MRARLPRTIGAVAALMLAAASTAHAQEKEKGHGRDKDRAQTVERENRRDDRREVRGEQRQDVPYVLRRDGVVLDPRRDARYDPQIDPRYDSRNDPRSGSRYDPRYDAQARRVPPGLAKKPGGMPPGQYRKRYGADQGANVLRDVMGRRGYTVVRTEDAGSSQYVYYRLRDGSIRRAVVSPGTERLQFGNVPSSLLSEVLSRLY